MLAVSMTGFRGTFDPDPTNASGLAALKQRVDSCISKLPLGASNDVNAGTAIACSTALKEGMQAIEKLSFVNDADNAVVFDIARSLLTQWRNTDLGGKPSSTETTVRRIAAQKLGEDPVVSSISPTLAVQTLASVGRIERDESVILPLIANLGLLLSSRDIPAAVRTEAITTLKVIADPLTGFLAGTQKTAQEALRVAQAGQPPGPDDPIIIGVGPSTVTPIVSRTIPIVAGVILAAVTTGAIWYAVRHSHAAGTERLSDVGRARRRRAARLRRQRSRSR